MEYEWRRSGRRILIELQILKPAPATDLTAVAATALLDTGASSCGVSRAIAEQLNLPSIGKQPIITAGGIVQSERHLFRIGLPQPHSFPFIFDDITGFELIDDAPFQAVLGMDVLTRCDLMLHRDGRCILKAG